MLATCGDCQRVPREFLSGRLIHHRRANLSSDAYLTSGNPHGAPSYAGAYGQAYPDYAAYQGHPRLLSSHLQHPSVGLHPALSRIMDSHKTLFNRIAGVGHNAPTGPTMEAAQGGTLVFPQNPYIRSPRDFFMWEPK